MKAQVVSGFFIALLSLLAWEVMGISAGIVDAASKEVDFNDIADTTEDAEETKSCDSCYKIDGYCYERKKLFELPGSFGTEPVINKLGVLRSHRLLYYSFQAPYSDFSAENYVGYVFLDDPSLSGILQSKGPLQLNYSDFDINQRDNKVYLGSANGIWVIDRPQIIPPAVRLSGALNNNIVNIVSKDYVYYTRKGFNGIIKNKNGDYNFILEGNEITKFAVDKYVEYNVVYSNRTGLYAFNSKTQMEVKLHNYPFYEGITVDSDGVVYAWNAKGLHKVAFDEDFSKSELKTVSADLVVLDGGLTFESSNNNILYHEGKLLYQLSKTFTNDC